MRGPGLKFVVIAVILWWLMADTTKPAAPATRETKELEIDDDVYSPTFGEAVSRSTQIKSSAASSPDVQSAIDKSTAAINGYVVPENPWGIQ